MPWLVSMDCGGHLDSEILSNSGIWLPRPSGSSAMKPGWTNRHHGVITAVTVLFSKCDSQMILQSRSLDTGYWSWLVRISPNVCSRCREGSTPAPRRIRWGLTEEEFKCSCFGGKIYASCPQIPEAEESCGSKMATDLAAATMLNEVVRRRGTESWAWRTNLKGEERRCFAEVKIISVKKFYVLFLLHFFGMQDFKKCPLHEAGTPDHLLFYHYFTIMVVKQCLPILSFSPEPLPSKSLQSVLHCFAWTGESTAIFQGYWLSWILSMWFCIPAPNLHKFPF